MRRIWMLIGLLFLFTYVYSQDYILLKNATEIYGKITEIGVGELKVSVTKDSLMPPVIQHYPLSDIFMVKYANGEQETFESPSPASERVYQVGDHYCEGETEGIVVSVKNGGKHGLIMSLDQKELPWLKYKSVLRGRLLGVTSINDGMFNMQIVTRIIQENSSLDWDEFPAFKWCLDKGEGWYLPALDEVIAINIVMKGGATGANHSAVRAFSKLLVQYGGVKMATSLQTSTESSQSRRWYVNIGDGPALGGTGVEMSKIMLFNVRAVKKF